VHQRLIQVQHERLLLALARLARQQRLPARQRVVLHWAECADEHQRVKLIIVIVCIV
jgi:hypothetical protein